MTVRVGENSTAVVYKLLGDGEIQLTRGLSSIFANGTPLIDPDYEVFMGSLSTTGSVTSSTVTVDEANFFDPIDNTNKTRYILIHKAGKTVASGVNVTANSVTINTPSSFFETDMIHSSNTKEGTGLVAKIRIPGAGPNGQDYVGTVVSITSATEAKLEPAISTTVNDTSIHFDHFTTISAYNSDECTLAEAAGVNVSNTRVEISAIETNFGDLGVPSYANFDNFLVSYRSGTRDQEPVSDYAGFTNSGSGISINKEIKQNSDYSSKNGSVSDFDNTEGDTIVHSSTGTYNFGLTDPGSIDEVKFTINAPKLFRSKPKSGTEDAISVTFQVSLEYTSDGSNWASKVIYGPTDSEIATLSNVNYLDVKNRLRDPFSSSSGTLGGKGSQAPIKTEKDYQFSIDLEPYKPFTQFRIRIKRLTAVNYTHGDFDYFNDTVLKSAQAIIKDKLSYPYSAYAAALFDSKEFSGEYPELLFDASRVGIEVPTNYITREENDGLNAKYTRNVDTGADEGSYQRWDGLYRGDKSEFGADSPNYKGVFCDNPIWGLRDLILNKRVGLGDFIRKEDFKDYPAYSIARYCDELVSDGKGGLEPRFRMSLWLTTSTEAYKVLKDMATTFIGMAYWLDGGIYLDTDRAKEPVYTFTKGNVIDGKFNYEGTGSKVRPNQIIVSYENPDNFFKQTPTLVEDLENIVKTGTVVQEQAVAFGCFSEAQARRYGKWKLLTAKERKEIVSFKSFINAQHLKPGDVIEVQDADRSRVRLSGRISAGSTSTSVPIDSPINIDGDNSYELFVIFPSGGAYLVSESATINEVEYTKGDYIPLNSEGEAISSEEDTANLVDDSGNAVDAYWSGSSRVEVRTLTNSEGSASTLTFEEEFSELPEQDYIWAIVEYTPDGDIVAGSSKTYKILNISENKGEYSFTAAEQVNWIYDEIDEEYVNLPVQTLPRKDSRVPDITNFAVTVKNNTAYSEGSSFDTSDVVLSWSSPKETSLGVEQQYKFLTNYRVHHNIPGYDSPVTVNSKDEVFTFKNVAPGEYDFRIQSVGLTGIVSKPKITRAVVETPVNSASPKQFNLIAGGEINSYVRINGSTLSILDSEYEFINTNFQTKYVTSGTTSIDLADYNSSSLGDGDTAYIIYDFSSGLMVPCKIIVDNNAEIPVRIGDSSVYSIGTCTVSGNKIYKSGATFLSSLSSRVGKIVRINNRWVRLNSILDNENLFIDEILSDGTYTLYVPSITFDLVNDNLIATVERDGSVYYLTLFVKIDEASVVSEASTNLGFDNFAEGIEPISVVNELPNPSGYTGSNLVFLTSDSKVYRYNGTSWTSAVPSTDISGQLQEAQIAVNAITKAKLANGLSIVENVDALPTIDNYSGRLAFLSTDSKLYRHNGTSWTAAVPSTDISGTLTSDQIAALEAAKITGTLTDGQIEALSAIKISGQLTASQIESLSSTQITGTLTSDQIASLATSKLSGLVTDDQINALSAAKVTGTLVSTQIASVAAVSITGTLTNDQIAALASTKITGLISSEQINSIVASKVSGTLTNAQIADLAATKITGTLTDTQIADLAASKITGQLSNAQINSLAANKITGLLADTQIEAVGAIKITGTLTSDQIAALAATKITGTLSDTQIAELSANKITGQLSDTQIGGVGATKITGTLTSDQIATLAATKITGTLSDTQIANLSANKVVGQLTNDQLQAIAAVKITGTLTSDQIASLSAAKLTGQITSTQITDSSITTPKIATGAVVAASISAGAIVAEKLAIGSVTASKTQQSGEIITPDPYFQDTAYWIFDPDGWQFENGTPGLGSPPRQLLIWDGFYTGTAQRTVYGRAMPVKPGTVFEVEATFETISASKPIYAGMNFYDSSGAYLSTQAIVSSAGSSNEKKTGQIVAHNSAATCQVVAFIEGGVAWGGIGRVTGIQIRKTAGATLIQDGAIITQKLAAASIIGEKIAAGTITATNIAANTITAALIAANTITAAQIAAGTITSSQIAAGTIQAANIQAGTITATQIATGTIIAENIAAGQITTAKIAAGAITTSLIGAQQVTAENILANTITSSQIAANTIVAANIAASTITGDRIATGTLTAANIQAGAIIASKLVLSGNNANPDPYFDDLAWWELSDQSRIAGNPAVNQPLGFMSLGVGTGDRFSGWTPTDVGGDYRMRVRMYVSPGATGKFGPIMHRPGTEWSLPQANSTFSDGTNAYDLSTVTQDQWIEFSQIYNMPAPYCGRVQFRTRWEITNGYVEFQTDLVRAAGGNLIVDGAVTATKIAANTIVANNIAGGTITGEKIATGTIQAANIQAGTITGTQVAAQTIAATNIVSGTITAAQIAANTIVAANIAAATITGEKIAAATIQAANIQTGTITATQIAGSTITGEKVAANTITGNNIAANTISAANIVAGTIGTDQLAANAVTAVKIAAGSIVASKVVLSDTTNLIQDSRFLDTGGSWSIYSPSAFWITSNPAVLDPLGADKGYHLPQAGTSQPGTRYDYATHSDDAFIQIEPGRDYLLKAKLYVGSGFNAYISHDLEFYTAGGSLLPGVNGQGGYANYIDTAKSEDGVVELSGSFTAPSNAAKAKYRMVVDHGESYASKFKAGHVTFSQPSLRIRNNAELIVDGTITSTQIAAGTIQAANIEAGTITSAQIATGTITSAQIATGTITATQIAGATITGEKIAASTIQASNIVAGTITAAQIAGATITGEKIAAGTIQAANITSGTITSTQIQARTITADRIALNSITASEITANTITAGQIAAGTITATQIAGGTITAAQIQSGTITAAQIAGGTITGTQIAANTISSAHIVANTITAGQIQAAAIGTDQLAANAVTATKIAAYSITASKLVLSGNNANPDPYFNDLEWWQLSDQTRVAGNPAVNQPLGFMSLGVGTGDRSSPMFPTEVGGDYRMRVRMYVSPGATGKFAPVLHRPNTEWSLPGANSNFPSDHGAYDLATITQDQWIEFSQIYNMPAPYCGQVQFRTRWDITSGYVEFQTDLVRAAGANLIVDGAITTDKLAANSITANKMSVGSLSAIVADLGTVTAGVVKNSAGDAGFNATLGVMVDFANGIMSVRGKPFGDSNQFREWTGPTPSGASIEDPKLSTLSTSGAIRYVLVSDGKMYQGGTELGSTDGSGPSFSIDITGITSGSNSVGNPASVSLSASASNGTSGKKFYWTNRHVSGTAGALTVNNDGRQSSIQFTKTIQSGENGTYEVELRVTDESTGETLTTFETITFSVL